MSIFPYIYHMVRDFHIAETDDQIAVYAGMVTSAFTLAEFSTGVMWGRLSDKIGRKPVLLMGLAGTALSSLVFGFAPNLAVALIARALGGLLNGYVSILNLLSNGDTDLGTATLVCCKLLLPSWSLSRNTSVSSDPSPVTGQGD